MAKKKRAKHKQRLIAKHSSAPLIISSRKEEAASRKYRSEKYIEYIFQTEMGIYASSVLIPEMTDAEVFEALESLIERLKSGGRLPAVSETTETATELITSCVVHNLNQLPPLSSADLAGCLKEVLASARTRAQMQRGPRGYLKFLAGFMRDFGVQVRWEKQEEAVETGLEEYDKPLPLDSGQPVQEADGFKVGDSVRVKPGVLDPDLNGDIGGWQGRIIGITRYGDLPATITIKWDSLTLKEMPDECIRQCELKGLDWAIMNLESRELEPAMPRDSEQDTDRVQEEIARQHTWDSVGEAGLRIQNVLAGVDPDDEQAALDAWDEYLTEHLTFPFEAEIVEFQERGPLQTGDRVTVTGIAELDDQYGLVVNVRKGSHEHHFPLCDLQVVNERSPNYQPVEDYSIWFSNR